MKKYYIVGIPIGRTKYIIAKHDSISLQEAQQEMAKIDGFESLSIIPEDKVKYINGHDKPKLINEDIAKEQLEEYIKNAIQLYIMSVRKKPKSFEIFVGHEHFEVEITII